jgi:hypothetical protein
MNRRAALIARELVLERNRIIELLTADSGRMK